MFKFIKENLIDPIKEGWEEGKAELEEEKRTKEQNTAQAKIQIQQLPFPEKFVLALAAPFRAVFLEKYFSLFSFDPEEPTEIYLNMYQLGILTEKEKSQLSNAIQRDFGISDQPTALENIFIFSLLFNDSGSDCLPLDDSKYDDIISSIKLLHESGEFGKNGEYALGISIIAYIITSCVDLEIFSKEEGNNEIAKLIPIAQKHYHSWSLFGQDFLKGDQALKLNHALGHKVLSKVVATLLKDKGSPWNQVSWIE